MRQRFVYLLVTSVTVTIFLIFFQDNVQNVQTSMEPLQLRKKSQDIVDFLDNYTKIIFTPQLIENLPNIYFDDAKASPSQFNKSCAKFPKLLDIEWTSSHWQTQKTSNGTFYLFSAHLDDRIPQWAVRVVGMFDQNYPNQTFYCQIWTERNQSPEIVAAEKFLRIFVKGWGGDRPGFLQPYIITCPLTNNSVPMSVSIVEFPCHNPTTNLRVEHKKIEENLRKNFVVCVKGLSFPYEDKSLKLLEWIELLFILGADKIVFYNFKSHPRIEKILRYYSAKNKIEVIPLTLIGGASNHPYLQNQYLHKKTIQRRLQEVIPYNDCFYKNFQEYRYVTLLDTDEIIVPTTGTWSGLVKILEEILPGKTSYMARNVYFLDSFQHEHDWFEGIPQHMHMLQHVWRAKNYTSPGAYVKGFHDSRKILALHNHFPIGCIGGCKHVNFDVALGHLQHYRSDCVAELKKSCGSMKNNSVMDTRIWAFKDEVIQRVEKTLEDLEFFDN